MSNSATQEEKQSLYRKLRITVFPVKPGDPSLVRLGKNTGFIVFFVVAALVSVALLVSVILVL
ncbi:hypothetical protein A8C56_10790 [Niabella ginsenosidivorans]|uniref:Uncharacterized protein n=1 Tax=Niabella ginsenosidivorans TaxID=1176587 RepID=A0A1A9I1A8_9BACT|nr:hypothetical protein [Niabella ginsenosidivorans]ANH81406.1 hypothetical protein A8C56_10790 [Niabella ginsenosidivorans]